MQLVSVIVSTLNGSKFIESLVKCLRAQEHSNLEVIFIVDSRTNDDTLELVKVYGSGLSNCRVIIQDDVHGLGESRNIGLDAANGEYIWFMDVDDRPYPDFISTLVKLMEDNGADLAISNFIRSSIPGINEHGGDYRVMVLNRDQAMDALMSDRIPVTAWSKIIRTGFLRDNKIRFPRGFSEDIGHTYWTIGTCSKAVYCSKPMYIYFQNEWSYCASAGNERGKGEIAAYRNLMDPLGHIKGLRRRCATMMLRSAVHMDYKGFREYVRSKEFKEVGKANLRDPLSLEYVCARTSPLLYYCGLQFYLKFFYYRELRCYTKV